MKHAPSILWLLLCIQLLPLVSQAERSYTPNLADPLTESWRWRNEEALEGLGIVCMEEAPNGTLWFGAPGKIISYDGIQVDLIEFDDAFLSKINHRRSTPRAKALLALPDGGLLVLIGESLVLRSGNEWQVIIQNTGRSNFRPELERDASGTCWLSVPQKLWRISPDLSRTTVMHQTEQGGVIGSMCVDESNRLWVVEKSTDQQARLLCFPAQNRSTNPTITPRTYPLPMPTMARELRIEAGPAGKIWYADDDINIPLLTFDPENEKWEERHDSPPSRYFSLSRGNDGTIWAGGEQMLVRISPEADAIQYTAPQLPQPQVPLSAFETGRGQLWVLGRIGYVYSMDIGTGEWLTYEDLHFHCETEAGVQWFVERRHSVVQHDPQSGEWKRFFMRDGLIDDIHALHKTHDGLIWATGSHEGRAAFSTYDGKTWRRVRHPEFATWIEPNAFMEAADGTVWLGAGGDQILTPSAGGVLQYGVDSLGNPVLIKHHAPPNIPYYVTALAESTDQAVWLGSISPAWFHPAGNEPPQVTDLLGMNSVNMAYDQNQALWLGKEDAGVYRLKDREWTLFSTRDGLAGARVSDLLILKDETIVAATGAGISRFDGRSWTTHAFPEAWTMSSRWSGIHEAKDGSLWFNFIDQAPPSQSDGKRHYTIRYRPETDAPDTHINEYLERVSHPGNIHISWSASDPWSRTSRDNLTYSWRLNGNEWSPFTSETGNTFLNLDRGNHVLEVRSRDRAFNIDPSPARIDFKVIPPIWQQPWFLILIFGLSGLIILQIVLAIRNREKHLIQRQLERENHLQELDRLKTGFFTNISHELRTPLTVVSGRLENLFRGGVNEEQQQELSIIERNISRLTTLVTQLLDFRKIEEGTIREVKTRGDLSTALQDWMTSMQVMAEKKEICCTLQCMKTCPGLFDFDKIQKIFSNLISNAIKYTDIGGEVRAVLQVQENQSDGRTIILTVEDNGVGISKEHQHSIFDRFYRVSEESMAAGAGIGLNLTHELVQLLGGSIHVESPVLKDPARPGSRFSVELPFQEEEASAPKDTPPALDTLPDQAGQAMASDSLILVIEDDEDIRDLIIQGLKPSYRVEMAENGALGLEKARKLVPDLIVTDLMMPVMDGVELCRELKNNIESSHIPIIMLTAKASLESQLEGLKTGADDYVTKPFNMELLQVRITNLLESRRILREKFCREYALSPTIPTKNSVDDAFLKKALGVLEARFAESGFNTDQLATDLHMSARSLQRKMKAVTDRTPKEFINEFRMKRAAERLLSSTETIAEIAFEIGMDEPSNFTRLFKAHLNMTPTQYRSANKN